MKPFIVAVYVQRNINEVFFRTTDNRQEELAYIAPRPGSENAPGHDIVNNPINVYFTDTENQARALAQSLATNHPGISVLVGNTAFAYTSERPRAVPISIARLTPQGFIPE